jgi:arylesterase/paraoxonase
MSTRTEIYRIYLSLSIVFPGLEDLPTYLTNVEKLGKTVLVPAGALRLRRSNDYTTCELVWFNDGSILSDMTAGAIDPDNNVFIGAAVLQFGGFAVCDLRPDALT